MRYRNLAFNFSLCASSFMLKFPQRLAKSVQKSKYNSFLTKRVYLLRQYSRIASKQRAPATSYWGTDSSLFSVFSSTRVYPITLFHSSHSMSESLSFQPVLDTWFGGDAQERMKRWFSKNPDFDNHLKENFERVHQALIDGKLEDWLETPKGRLAAIIVLDQFSRNMYRDTPKMFAADELARKFARLSIEKGDEKEFDTFERMIVYLPFEHSESKEDQEFCVKKFADMLNEKGASVQPMLTFANEHKVIIDKFGRFPHRNEILGRESTQEEIDFLKTPGSSF